MKISFFNGVSGVMAFQEDMNRIAHNVANSGTVGYKPDRSTFSDLLYTRMAVNSEKEPLTGHGVRINDAQMIYKQGPVLQTGCTLDFALLGDGFFAVRTPKGDIEYTRNGSFDISIEGDKGYLVTEDGSHVLGFAGRDIELERPSKDGMFNLEGLQMQIGIYDFANPYALEHATNSRFTPTDTSGEATAILPGRSSFDGRNYRLMDNALEQSAVELGDEMVNVITAQRAYQMNAKMIQTADELEQVINNLR